MNSLRAMHAFVQVVRLGSLSSAGRKLSTSPASISRYIQALEDHVGARLLNRTSRRLSLTEAGETYLRHAEQILQQTEEMHQNIAQLQKSPIGTLRVHSRVAVGQLIVIPSLPRFFLSNPEIKLDLQLSNQNVDLIKDNIDLDIRIGRIQDVDLIARRLLESERLVCASPAYLKRSKTIVRPSDLAQHNCLTYRVGLGQVNWYFEDNMAQTTKVPVTGSLQTDYGPALRECALQGTGIILTPKWSVWNDLRAGTLVRLLPEYRVTLQEYDDGVYALYQRSRFTSTKVKLFLDHLVSAFTFK